MNDIPTTGFLRLHQIIGRAADPEAKPPRPAIPAIIPVAASTWWKGVKSGRYPQPVRTLGATRKNGKASIAAWRVSDIRALLSELEREDAA